MKPKTMILMALAITCGLGASWMTSRLIAGRNTNVEEETATFLVAKQGLNVGEQLKKPEDRFVFKTVAAKDVPEGAIKDPELLKEKIMKKSRNKGDHITLGDLIGKDEQLDIPEGHEGVGVRVNLETSASGFASLPRSRVNVIHTVRVNNNDINLSYVHVLLEDVLVLAADTVIDRDKGIAAPAQVVTLALTPAEAMKITGAKGFGELTLTLRKPGDHSRTDKPLMTFAEIKASTNSQETKAQPSTESLPRFEAPPVAATRVPEEAPKVASKDMNEPAAPANPIPEVEAPKIVTSRLLILNGNQRQVVESRRTEDGRPVDDDGEVQNPAPAPQPQAVPNRQKRGVSQGDL